MRKIFIRISTLLLIMLSLAFLSGNKTSLTFKQALQDGLISLNFQGRAYSELPDDASSYYGACLYMRVKNISGKTLSLRMDNGRILHSVDTDAQDFIITKPLIMALNPASEKTSNLYAMCTQMSHWSPGEEDAFNLGPMAGEDLRNLTAFIDQNNMQNETGQDGIWVLTDALPIHTIQGLPDEVKKLKDYLKPMVKKINSDEGTIRYKTSGIIKFRLSENAQASMIIYDPEGKEYQVYFKDKFFKRGIYSLNYDYSNAYMKPGIYTLKLKIEGKSPIFKQFIVPEN